MDVSILPNFNVGDLIIIDHQNFFRIARVKRYDLSTYQMIVSCFDPPLPASIFIPSKSPDLYHLTTSIENFTAAVLTPVESMSDGRIQLTLSQIISIERVLDLD